MSSMHVIFFKNFFYHLLFIAHNAIACRKEINENIKQSISTCIRCFSCCSRKLDSLPVREHTHPSSKLSASFIKRQLALQAFYDVGTLIMS